MKGKAPLLGLTICWALSVQHCRNRRSRNGDPRQEIDQTPSDTSSCLAVKIDGLILHMHEGMPGIKHKLTRRD